MSGYTEEAVFHRALLSPDTVFLQKPFTSEKLTMTVRDALDSAQVFASVNARRS
jgi:hypothetical protein